MWCKFANPRFSFSISFFFFRRVLLGLRMRWDHMCNPRWAASFNKINFELCCAPDHFLYVYQYILLKIFYWEVSITVSMKTTISAPCGTYLSSIQPFTSTVPHPLYINLQFYTLTAPILTVRRNFKKKCKQKTV